MKNSTHPTVHGPRKLLKCSNYFVKQVYELGGLILDTITPSPPLCKDPYNVYWSKEGLVHFETQTAQGEPGQGIFYSYIYSYSCSYPCSYSYSYSSSSQTPTPAPTPAPTPSPTPTTSCLTTSPAGTVLAPITAGSSSSSSPITPYCTSHPPY